MDDEFSREQNEHPSDEEGGDPEVPLLFKEVTDASTSSKPKRQKHGTDGAVGRAFIRVGGWARAGIQWIFGRNWTAIATVAIAVTTFFYTRYAKRQWEVMSGQLTEMQRQYPELQKSADAAKTAAQIAELSERPWIKIVDVRTLGNNPVIPALSFQGFGHGPFPHGTRQITFQTKVSLKNLGHSVGDVVVDQELFLPLWAKFFDMMMAEQKRYCDHSLYSKSDSPAKAVLFPDEPFDWHAGPVALVDEVNINHFERGNPAGYVIPVVIVCVNYRASGSTKTYQTRALYEVFRRDNRTRFFDVGVDFKQRDIFLIRQQFADAAY